uniref:Uncharacterized protein n=1 Tax=Anguilla anguilla TaxID=7936 RepID=A0A0E9QAF9_ANGAN
MCISPALNCSLPSRSFPPRPTTTTIKTSSLLFSLLLSQSQPFCATPVHVIIWLQ